MKIQGSKVQQGIKIKAVGLTAEERKIIEDAMRRIRMQLGMMLAKQTRRQKNRQGSIGGVGESRPS